MPTASSQLKQTNTPRSDVGVFLCVNDRRLSANIELLTYSEYGT